MNGDIEGSDETHVIQEDDFLGRMNNRCEGLKVAVYNSCLWSPVTLVWLEWSNLGESDSM